MSQPRVFDTTSLQAFLIWQDSPFKPILWIKTRHDKRDIVSKFGTLDFGLHGSLFWSENDIPPPHFPKIIFSPSCDRHNLFIRIMLFLPDFFPILHNFILFLTISFSFLPPSFPSSFFFLPFSLIFSPFHIFSRPNGIGWYSPRRDVFSTCWQSGVTVPDLLNLLREFWNIFNTTYSHLKKKTNLK